MDSRSRSGLHWEYCYIYLSIPFYGFLRSMTLPSLAFTLYQIAFQFHFMDSRVCWQSKCWHIRESSFNSILWIRPFKLIKLRLAAFFFQFHFMDSHYACCLYPRRKPLCFQFHFMDSSKALIQDYLRQAAFNSILWIPVNIAETRVKTREGVILSIPFYGFPRACSRAYRNRLLLAFNSILWIHAISVIEKHDKGLAPFNSILWIPRS